MAGPRLLRVLGLLAPVVAVAGCIVFVNDDPSIASNLHTGCSFSGSDSVCAACVASSCTRAFDDCCGDLVCSTTALTELGACAPGQSGCATLLEGQPELLSCVAGACAVACGTSAGLGNPLPDGGASDSGVPPAPTGSTNCFAVEDECSCTVGNPNGVTCSGNTTRSPGICCAQYGWPNATDSYCNCEPFSCMPEGSSGDVYCGLSPTSSLTTTATGNCCATADSCMCTESTGYCQNPVAQCDITTIGCGASETQVDSCSF